MYETFFMNQNSFTFVSVYLDPAKFFFIHRFKLRLYMNIQNNSHWSVKRCIYQMPLNS